MVTLKIHKFGGGGYRPMYFLSFFFGRNSDTCADIENIGVGIENSCINDPLIHRMSLRAAFRGSARKFPFCDALVFLYADEQAGLSSSVEKVSLHVQVSGSLLLQGSPWTEAPLAPFSWRKAFSLLCLGCVHDGAC